MAKGKSEQKASGNRFAGVQREERTLSALPIRIDYRSPQSLHICRPQGSDYLFCEAPFTMQGVSAPATEAEISAWHQQPEAQGFREQTHLDPFAIREAFFAVEDPTTATRFLSDAGSFWPFREVLWSQFQKWQAFFRWLQVPYEKAQQSDEGRKAWRAAEDYDHFFVEALVPDWVREDDADGYRQITAHRRQRLIHLHHFAMRPERLPGHCLSIQWSAAGDTSFQPAPPVPMHKGKEQKPYLSIEVHNILEAIAATVYADRCSGVEYERCKECGKLFRVESGHGQVFCPPPPYPSTVKTSACKNRYTQRQRRARIKKDKEKALAKKKRPPAR